MTDALSIARDLLRLPFGNPGRTPARSAVLENVLEGAGLRRESHDLSASLAPPISTIFMRASAVAHPHITFAGHTDVVSARATRARGPTARSAG